MAGAIFQVLLAGGLPPATATFIAKAGFDSTGVSSTHNFSISLGDGGNIAVLVYALVSGSFTAVTIGGITATIQVQRNAGGTNAPVAIATAVGCPSGTQTVAVTVSGAGATLWACHSYKLNGLGSQTPTATGSDAHTLGGCSGNFSVVEKGCTLGAGVCGNGGTPASWSGLTKDDETVSGTQVLSGAHLNSTVASAATAWSVSFGGANNQTAAVWASWGPVT